MTQVVGLSRKSVQAAGLIVGLAIVTGCTEEQNLGFLQSKDSASGTEAPKKTKAQIIEQDAEAPDVFHSTEAGLWDGRPSLGGVWVAHPDVTDPERVMIVNKANGKSVVGALFRRERDIPGPRIQASSDAAQALGMLAGAPVELDVVALRRQEIQPEPTVVAEQDAETPDQPEAVADATDDVQSTVVAQSAAPDTQADDTQTDDATPTDTVAEASTEKKQKKPLFGWLKKNKAPVAAATATAAATGATSDVAQTVIAESDSEELVITKAEDTAAQTPDVTSATLDEAEPVVTTKTRKPLFPWLKRKNKTASADVATSSPVISDAGDDVITQTTLDPIAGAAAAIEASGANTDAAVVAASASSQTVGTITPGSPEVTPTRTTAKTSRLGKPFVQIGIFNVESNADRTATQMRSAGMIPTVLEQNSGGKTFWRVLVGPAQSRSERTALLNKVKETGFSDAYYVSN